MVANPVAPVRPAAHLLLLLLCLLADGPVGGRAQLDEPAASARCTDRLTSLSSAVNAACCPTPAACAGGVPSDCSEQCAALWEPFALKCSRFLEGEFPQFTAFTSKCEVTAFPAGGDRCGEAVWQAQMGQIATDCCGSNGELCTGPVPAECSAGCIETFETFYARCHPEFATRAPEEQTRFTTFLSTCQAADDAPLAPPPPPSPEGGGAAGQGAVSTDVSGCAGCLPACLQLLALLPAPSTVADVHSLLTSCRVLLAVFDNFDDGIDGWTSNVDGLATTGCAALGNILGGMGILGQGAYVEKVYDLSNYPHAELTISMDYIKIE
jgi:hypothetical protein